MVLPERGNYKPVGKYRKKMNYKPETINLKRYHILAQFSPLLMRYMVISLTP